MADTEEQQLKIALSNMKEAVLARLEMKVPSTVAVESDDEGFADTLRRLWDRFFSKGE